MATGPRFDEVDAELQGLNDLRDKQAGNVRLSVDDHPAETILLPAAARLLLEYPNVNVEISVNNGLVDIVAEGFDAGVRLGETLAHDLIAVPISPDLRMAVVGAPAYLVTRGVPRVPDELAVHNCIGLRFRRNGGTAVWDLERDGRTVNARVGGQLVVNSVSLVRQSALRGLGLAYVMADQVRDDLRSGALVQVLEDWCPPFPGYYLYYPRRRQQSPALTLLIEALRYRG